MEAKKKTDISLATKAAIFTGTIAPILAADMVEHWGVAGLAIGAVGAYAMAKESPKIWGEMKKALPFLPELSSSSRKPGERTIIDRLINRYPDPIEDEQETEVVEQDDEMEELQPRPRDISGLFTFSQVLRGFQPSLNQIYLATLEDGSAAYSLAKGLCHVALAGSTGNGKSSIIRLLMAQLCKAGASVVLLNPHYTRYDLDAQEDWTPYEPYLEYLPMECRKYDVIESILERAATVILPKRLDAYAESRPIGKPYFLVLDELPAIMAHIKDAPEYLAAILREGRKVGIFLICASQDFLVKTLKLDSGAMRDCYRTAFYVGGDSTTARVLLDWNGLLDETKLGQGTVMLRCKQTKQAVLAHVPYVDNEALYRLLGPSTYQASDKRTQQEESLLEPITDALESIPGTPMARFQRSSANSYEAHKQRLAGRKAPIYARETQDRVTDEQPAAKSELDLALEAYDAGSTTVDALAVALGKTQWTVRPLYAQVKQLRQK